jgi:hypothetical protein
LAARPSSAALLDVAVAATTFAGSLALLAHGGIYAIRPGAGSDASQPGSGELELVGVVLVACSTVPLIGWRRSPLGVFAVTAAAGVLLAALGYRMDLLLGPAAALYLLAASRQPPAADPLDTADHRHRRRAAAGLPRRRRRAAGLPRKRAAAHRAGLGGRLVRWRANPPAARAAGRVGRARPAR